MKVRVRAESQKVNEFNTAYHEHKQKSSLITYFIAFCPVLGKK